MKTREPLSVYIAAGLIVAVPLGFVVYIAYVWIGIASVMPPSFVGLLGG